MIPPIERFWQSFERAVDRLDARCQPEAAKYRRHVMRSANDAFVLRCAVSYVLLATPAADELLVVSLDLKRDGTAIQGEIDLAWGDGGLVSFSALPRVESDGAGLEDAITFAERFIDLIAPLLGDGLRAGKRP